MKHNVSTEPPPIYAAAVAAFGRGADFDTGTVFTYGDTIHVKNGRLSGDLVAHETTHVVQQTTYPGGPGAWWKRYIEDPQFRLAQEMEAYARQWDWVKKHVPKRQQFDMLKFFATCLCNKYGFEMGLMAAISKIQSEPVIHRLGLQS